MPQMPALNKSQDALSSVDSGVLLSGESDNMSDSPVLDAPLHDDKPLMQSYEDGNASIMKAPSTPKKGIEVVALRKGFYNQFRINEGEKFLIRSEKDFGDWFRCTEPSFEKKRIEFINAKKAKK